MIYPQIEFAKSDALALDDFRKMDYYAVDNYSLPIELMMENAGLLLARLAASATDKSKTVQVGIGNGNNGGGGLVAARRLAAWGYKVHLSIFAEITKELPLKQFNRAILFGVSPKRLANPDLWIDAWLGFSQRLPLESRLIKEIEKANNSNAQRISLDIPTGFLGDTDRPFFKADKVLTLAAPKKILFNLDKTVSIYVADLGIPEAVYKKFNMNSLPFEKRNIIELKRK